MANQPETSTWEAGIYQFETTDVVEGGVGGIDNKPLLQLANRTKWLYDNRGDGFLKGDIKEVACTQAYISANFNGTGLGTNERLGWAICNGQNGTFDLRDRVTVGSGGGLGTGSPGYAGGNNSSHLSQAGYNVGGNTSGSGAGRLVVTTGNPELGENFESIAAIGNTANDAAVVSIEQRYTIVLKIQKL